MEYVNNNNSVSYFSCRQNSTMVSYEIAFIRKVTNMETHTHMDVCLCVFIKWTRTENKTKHIIHLDKSEFQKKTVCSSN